MGKNYKILNQLPWIIFGLWFIGFLLSYGYYGTEILHWLFVEDTTSRYFIGLPGAVITALALHRNSKYLLKLSLKDIAIKLNGMALLFLLYGIFAGIIVNKSDFFPANVINKIVFYQLFRFPVELARAISALGITVLFISAIDIFRWETNQKIAILSKVQLISKERRKLGRELHDGIIQNLFATGLQVENLMEMETDKIKKDSLLYIKNTLNESIDQVREFIKKIATQSINIEELRERLTELVKTFEKTSGITIDFQYNVGEMSQGLLSNEKVTQMYYVIQEAVSNAIKHADASKITVIISGDLKAVIVTIADNGGGFNPTISNYNNGHYGLISMKERAVTVAGTLSIDSNHRGTMITLTIPWEDNTDEERY